MLVDYSDSDSEIQQEPEQVSKRKLVPSSSKAPPPLPAAFHSLYATNVRTSTSDDPSLHGGRSRQVPHIEGNWPTHVYLEWLPTKDSLGQIQEVIAKLQDLDAGQSSISSFLLSELGVHQPLHVSLSAPLVLQTEQKDDFVEDLIKAIRASSARSFQVHPTGLAWVPNFEGTRYFLVLKLTRPKNDDLNKLLAACNACAGSRGLPLLYHNEGHNQAAGDISNSRETEQDRSGPFHISVAWTLEKPSDDQKATAEAEAHGQLCNAHIECSSVKIKIGNIVTDVPLAP